MDLPVGPAGGCHRLPYLLFYFIALFLQFCWDSMFSWRERRKRPSNKGRRKGKKKKKEKMVDFEDRREV